MNTVLGLILLLFSFIILWVILFLFVEDRYRTVLATGLSISLALLGISLAIANDYLSQYDYTPKKIKENEEYRKNGIEFDTIVKTDTIPPYYIFVRDVSRSILENEIPVDGASAEKMMRRVSDYIPDSLKRTIEFFDKIKGKKKIYVSDLIKLRLMYSVISLDSIFYTKESIHDSIKYSIINFGDSVYPRDYNTGKLTDRINTTLQDISKREVEDYNTRFIQLFECLSMIIDSIGAEQRDQYYRRDVIIYFYTDYKNDNGKKKEKNVKKKLQEHIRKIENSSVNLKLYVWEEDEEEEKKEKKVPNKREGKKLYVRDFLKDNCDSNSIVNLNLYVCEEEVPNKRESKKLNVRDFLKDNLDSTSYEQLDIRELNDEIDYPITIKHPFPFYYSNSLFEDSLETKILFNTGGKYSIRLGKYNNSMKQEYRLYKKHSDRKDTIKKDTIKKDTIIRLSKYDTTIFVKDSDTVSINIRGYIPSPYQCPDIIIKDSKNRVEYTIPVVFYMVFPESSKWILWFIIFFQSVIIIQLLNILFEGGSIMVRPSDLATTNSEPKTEDDEDSIDVDFEL